MSLIDDLKLSKKIDPILASRLKEVSDVDAKEQSLSVLFATSAAIPVADNPIEGVEVYRMITPKAYEAYISVAGLKALVDDERVTLIIGQPFKKGGPYQVLQPVL